jgi:hypothetical protein
LACFSLGRGAGRRRLLKVVRRVQARDAEPIFPLFKLPVLPSVNFCCLPGAGRAATTVKELALGIVPVVRGHNWILGQNGGGTLSNDHIKTKLVYPLRWGIGRAGGVRLVLYGGRAGGVACKNNVVAAVIYSVWRIAISNTIDNAKSICTSPRLLAIWWGKLLEHRL